MKTHRWLLLLWMLGSVLLLLGGCGGAGDTAVSATPTPTARPTATRIPTATPVPTATPRPTEPRQPTATPRPTLPMPTATPTPAPQQVRFAVISDLGAAGPVAEQMADLVKSWEPDFIVTGGDNNFPHGEAATIDDNIGQYYHEYIHPYQGSYGEGAETNRFFPILGNHDWNTPGATPHFDYFTLPGNERYYRVVREPVAIYALNSMPGEPDGIDQESAQAAWLQQELAASDTCWNLVFFHHTAYTSGHRGSSEWMRWPYPEWGADATFSGHNHVYERVMRDGFPYITTGLGGAPRYAFADTVIEGSVMRYNLDHGAMLVEVVDGNLTFQFITRTGEVIDTYTMEKEC